MTWLFIRRRWIDKLSDPKNRAEKWVLEFLQKKEAEDLVYFSEAIKEMEELISRPNTDWKYTYWFDVSLLNQIMDDYRNSQLPQAPINWRIPFYPISA